MRYRNPETGVDLDLGELDPPRKLLYERAQKLFRNNASWFTFERMAFSGYSPLFQGVTDRKAVVRSPLFKALQDMWLTLGVNQGYVAPKKKADARTTETKTRPAHSNRAASLRDVAPSRERRAPRRRPR
jgi:hypothetical protein